MGKKFIQQVCGKFLFLGHSVDPTLLCPISTITLQSASPTQDTLSHTLQLLDYLATQEDAVITYHASDMILAAHSDASYLSEPKLEATPDTICSSLPMWTFHPTMVPS